MSDQPQPGFPEPAPSWQSAGVTPTEYVPVQVPAPAQAFMPALASASEQPPPATMPEWPAFSSAPPSWAQPPAGAQHAQARPTFDREDVRVATRLVAALAVLGVVAGLLWAAISPHSAGYVLAARQVVPAESEQFISGDGKFVLITGVIGLLAGGICWTWRARRGPIIAAALGVGGTFGAVLTALVGRLVGGGHTTGAVNSKITLPIALHAHGLIAVEGGLALLVYLAATLMSAPDDLGRTVNAAGSSSDEAPHSQARTVQAGAGEAGTVPADSVQALPVQTDSYFTERQS